MYLCEYCQKNQTDFINDHEKAICDDCASTRCNICAHGECEVETSQGDYICIDCYSSGIDDAYDRMKDWEG